MRAQAKGRGHKENYNTINLCGKAIFDSYSRFCGNWHCGTRGVYPSAKTVLYEVLHTTISRYPALGLEILKLGRGLQQEELLLANDGRDVLGGTPESP